MGTFEEYHKINSLLNLRDEQELFVPFDFKTFLCISCIFCFYLCQVQHVLQFLKYDR